jgi:lactoylglutathione lyase
MNLQTLDYVVLLCADIGKTKAFYHEVLGLQVKRDWGDWIELRLGSVLLTLRPRGRSYDGPERKESAGVQLAFRVAPSEVETWYRALLQKHVEILEPPRDWDYGHRTLFFRDPEGNILEIYAEI